MDQLIGKDEAMIDRQEKLENCKNWSGMSMWWVAVTKTGGAVVIQNDYFTFIKKQIMENGGT